MNDAEARVTWLRQVIERDKAEAEALLTEEWGDRPWAVENCSENECPCIVYQGEYKPFDEPQVPPIHYIADAETPELATWIARHDPRSVIADCEAKLGILGLYDLWTAGPSDHPALGAAICAISDAVHHLASGYRYRDGYAEHWPALAQA